jgi:hypothetical protein
MGDCIRFEDNRLEDLISDGFRLFIALKPERAWSGNRNELFGLIVFLLFAMPPPILDLILLKTVIIILNVLTIKILYSTIDSNLPLKRFYLKKVTSSKYLHSSFLYIDTSSMLIIL